MSAYAHPVASVFANVYWCTQHLSNVHAYTCMLFTTPVKNACILSAKNAYGLVHARLCNGAQSSLPWKLLRTYLESCASIVQAVVFRPLLLPLLLSRPNPSPDAVHSRNSSKSTLAHDTVVAAVSHKHHSIIRVDAGLIQFVYGLHLCLATGVTSSRNLFAPFFRATFNLVLENTNTPKIIQNTRKCGLRHDTNVRFSNFRGWCSARFFFAHNQEKSLLIIARFLPENLVGVCYNTVW